MATADFRDRLLACLGGPWPDSSPLNATIEGSETLDGFRRDRIAYDVEPGERVVAYLLVPNNVSRESPAPGICVWHQHNGQWHLGMSEPAGIAGMEMHHTGIDLVRLGYVVLCSDSLGFGEREKGYRLKGGNLERYLFLKYVVAGKCLAWKNILDMKRAVDLLASRPEVRADRLGCYGHSMGSTNMWLVGPWEPRLKALVGNCCLPTYVGIEREQILHCFPNFIPGLKAFGDTPDIVALIAPRPLHLNFGALDSGSPIDEVRRGLETIRHAYESQHAESKFSSYIAESEGHVLNSEMKGRIERFFEQNLRD